MHASNTSTRQLNPEYPCTGSNPHSRSHSWESKEMYLDIHVRIIERSLHIHVKNEQHCLRRVPGCQCASSVCSYTSLRNVVHRNLQARRPAACSIQQTAYTRYNLHTKNICHRIPALIELAPRLKPTPRDSRKARTHPTEHAKHAQSLHVIVAIIAKSCPCKRTVCLFKSIETKIRARPRRIVPGKTRVHSLASWWKAFLVSIARR